MKRAASGSLSLLLGLLLLTGCAPWGSVCSTIGWSNTLTLTLASPRAGLSLELCDGAGCTPGRGLDAGVPTDEPLVSIDPSAVSPQKAPSGSPPDTGVLTIDGDGLAGWTAALLGGQPTIGYRVVDEAGGVVAEGEVDVDWVRVGGDERCGGPHEADVELPV